MPFKSNNYCDQFLQVIRHTDNDQKNQSSGNSSTSGNESVELDNEKSTHTNTRGAKEQSTHTV